MHVSRIRHFSEFWPIYVGEHRDPRNRALHYVGSGLALGCLGALIATGVPWWLVAGFVVGYGFAWIGHFGVEGNRPTTLRYPLWSFAADWKMFGLAITGRMHTVVEQLYGSPAPEPDAPLLVER